MLVDTVTITVRAGKGGDGKVSFKHLPGNYKGGPDGGNGGKGGDVYFLGVDDILGLAQFRYKKEIKGEDGIPGGKKKLFGKNGEDLVITLPLGTLITDTTSGEVWEIRSTTTPICIAKGGKGGRGNDEFKSATIQTPRYAEKGQLGEEKVLFLELKLIADVGFIGLPNAGKSSLLSVLTNAHPKIGDYPFTTLEPNIGMLGHITLADIPGLIQGASLGKGLGIQFLRHVEKTQLFIHCISCENEHIMEAYDVIRHELEEYNSQLLDKTEIILLTKTDLLGKEEVEKKVKELQKTKQKVVPISLYNDNDITRLKEFLHEEITHV